MRVRLAGSSWVERIIELICRKIWYLGRRVNKLILGLGKCIIFRLVERKNTLKIYLINLEECKKEKILL